MLMDLVFSNELWIYTISYLIQEMKIFGRPMRFYYQLHVFGNAVPKEFTFYNGK